MRVGAYAAVARRREGSQVGDELPLGIEQLVRVVATQPFLELGQLFRVLAHIRQRHLVRAEGALHGPAADHLRTRPTLWRAQDDGRPARPLEDSLLAGFSLDRANALIAVVECRG